jgi:D-glycero-D-manno-heptose 1,7-bisphosphate phosphatase
MKRRYVLLDRDGTLMHDRNYLADPAGIEILPGVVEGLKRFDELGLGLVVVTNQSGVGRGYFDAAAVERVNEKLIEILSAEGITFAGVYYCPHVDADECRCRKPRPGMAERAASELGFEPAESFVIGDREPDLGLGRAIGATTLLVRTGAGRRTEAEHGGAADYVVEGLPEAAEIIERLIRS